MFGTLHSKRTSDSSHCTMSCHHNAIWWSSSAHSVTSCGFGYWSQPEFKSIKWKLLEVTMSQIACHSGWHDELLSHSALSTQDVVHSFLQSIHCRASVGSLVHYLMHCCRMAMFEFKQPLCCIHTLCQSAYTNHLSSSHQVGISRIIKSTIKIIYFERETPYTYILLYSYNYYLLWLLLISI